MVTSSPIPTTAFTAKWHLQSVGVAELRTTSSPLVEGDLLVLVIGGKPDACVVALEKKTGREVWRALGEGAGYSSPILITAGNARQLIVWTTESISSLNPTTGASSRNC